MRFLSNTSFLAINMLLGLVVNVLTLAGFVFGLIQIKPGFGPLSKPGVVITLLYVFMALVWILVGFWLLGVVKRRNGIGPKQQLTPSQGWQMTFKLMMNVVTVPTTILWILAFGELVGWPQSGPGYHDDTGPLIFVIGGATLLFAGAAVGELVIAIDWLFNLDHYSQQPRI
jgi:hypothetical protein